MKLHGNAALSLNRRRVLVRRVVEEEWSLTKAAEAAEVSEPTARKWAARYLVEGEAGLLDRPSAAHHVHNRTPEDRIGVICALRRLRMTAAEIAEVLEMPETTVSGILTRSGLGRLGRLGMEPPRRYERSRPGELVHIDAKKLGRIQRGAGHRIAGQQHYNPTRGSRGQAKRTVGWEFVHVCIDDATRFAYVEVLGDERARTAVGFLRRAIRFFDRHRVTVERLLTDKRLRLSLGDPRDRLPDARDKAPSHPPSPSADQRQGRALHSHDARRLGLRRDLPQLGGAHRCARRLAKAPQLPAQARCPRPKATGSSARRAEHNALGAYI